MSKRANRSMHTFPSGKYQEFHDELDAKDKRIAELEAKLKQDYESLLDETENHAHTLSKLKIAEEEIERLKNAKG